MDVRVAADRMRKYIQSEKIPDSRQEIGKDHLHEMVHKIVSKQVEGEKAHRWLGYIQGVVVALGAATVEDVKNLNHTSKWE